MVSAAVVITDEAQDHSPLNGAGGGWSWAGDGRLLFKTLVRSGGVVVLDEGGQDASQMVLVENQEFIQARRVQKPHPAKIYSRR